MAYLFDTDALSEALRPRPARRYLEWLRTIGRSEQFTSSVVMAELYSGAFRSAESARHLQNIESRVLPAITVLAYDLPSARVYGRIRAHLELAGKMLADADLQIAATALQHDHEVMSGNLSHIHLVPVVEDKRIPDKARAAAR